MFWFRHIAVGPQPLGEHWPGNHGAVDVAFGGGNTQGYINEAHNAYRVLITKLLFSKVREMDVS